MGFAYIYGMNKENHNTNKENEMKTTRIQIEGDHGILAIINRCEQESGEHLNKRYVDTVNGLGGAARRAKVMSVDAQGNVSHDTITYGVA